MSKYGDLLVQVEMLVDQLRAAEAVALVEPYLVADPDSARLNALTAIAMACERETAVERAQRAVDLDSTDPFAYFALGFTYLMRFDYAAARQPYEQSLALPGHPRRADAFDHLVSVLTQLGDLPAARTVLDAANAEFPNSVDLETHARLLQAEGNRAEARRLL